MSTIVLFFLSTIHLPSTRDWTGNVIPSWPIVLSCAANVQDANFQTLAASTSILVHPSDLYVGFKMMSSWGNAGDPLHFSVVRCGARPPAPFSSFNMICPALCAKVLHSPPPTLVSSGW